MAGDGLQVIALISGGKDSLFSILHCLAQGHKIVALANLHPPLEETEDIDSYMYQTVGHSVIPLYEEALGLPLYRQPITGSAADASRDYRGPPPGDHADDETEALVPLLQRVKAAHPHANAVSTGAILSTYQRTRVESVALRLGLTPLSYLWQYPALPPYTQAQLLRDMRAVGMDARIVKVAGGALDETFLGLNVADERVVARLVASAERFGGVGDGAVLGEGGEFETLAVDGPGRLWKRRIAIEEQVAVSGEGGSAVLKIRKARLAEKEVHHDDGEAALRTPDMLDHEFSGLFHDLSTSSVVHGAEPECGPAAEEVQQPDQRIPRSADTTISADNLWVQRQVGCTLYISNMASSRGEGIKGQMHEIAGHLRTLLQTHDPPLTPAMIVSTTLLLRSMSDFGTVNQIYGSMFSEPNPPARVTVACGACMPAGLDVMVSVGVDLQPASARTGLHVQSRSYWAPANIGPYSQAIAVEVPRVEGGGREGEESGDSEEEAVRLVYVAGQIPLIPATMELVGGEDAKALSLNSDVANSSEIFFSQTVISLQHLWRIGRTMNVKWWIGAVAFLSSGCSEAVLPSRAATAMLAWRRLHERVVADAVAHDEGSDDGDGEDDEVDIWDIRNRVRKDGSCKGTDQQHHPPLPVFTDELLESARKDHPPVFVVQMEELPRGADIEWMSWGLTTTDLHLESSARRGTRTLSIKETQFVVSFVPVQTEEDMEVCLQCLPREAHCTIFLTISCVEVRRSRLMQETAAVLIPCKRVWVANGQEVFALVVARYSQHPAT